MKRHLFQSARVLAAAACLCLHLQGEQKWTAIAPPKPSVEQLAMDPGDERTLYVWGAQDGLYISRNGGASWSQPFPGPVADLAIDPREPGRIYVAAWYLGFSQGQVYASSDKGLTWSVTGTFPDPISALLVAHDGSIYAAPRNTKVPAGVYKSSDGGKTWNHSVFPTTVRNIICWDIEEDPKLGTLYVGTEIGDHPQPYEPRFFRSTDRGTTWEDVTGCGPPGACAISWHVIDIQVTADQDVHALSEGAGLYQSSDLGVTWRRRQVPFLLSLHADPFRPGFLYGGDHNFSTRQGGAYRSTDGGATWSPLGLDGFAVTSFALNKQGTRLYALAYQGGLFVTELGKPASLSIAKTHSGNFAQGQVNATYTVTVSNAPDAGPTVGAVTVTEAPPPGLTLVSMAGTGWTCSGNHCTRSDALAPAESYPAITVRVNVGAAATSPQVNQATVSGGGSASAGASDAAAVPLPAITSLAADPPSIDIGQTSAIGWQSNVPFVLVAVTSSPTMELVLPDSVPGTSGSIPVSPLQTTLFELTFSTAGGKIVTASATVAVNPPGFDGQGLVNTVDETTTLWPGAPARITGANLAAGEAMAGEQDSFPTVLNGVRVIFGETPAALKAVSPKQIDLFVPMEMAPDGDVWVQVQRSDSASEWVRVWISPPPPGSP